MPIQMMPVQSTAIKAIGYDPDTKTLYIEFNKVKKYPTYQFSPVSGHTAGRIFKSPSIGQYYHRNIKPRSRYQLEPSQYSLEKTVAIQNNENILWNAAKRYATSRLGG